jgi:hypothetical protein
MGSDYPVLDLHGERHYDADYLIEKFISDHFDALPVRVITGYSDFFIEKTKEIVTRHNLFCYPESSANEGCYLILESPWFNKKRP